MADSSSEPLRNCSGQWASDRVASNCAFNSSPKGRTGRAETKATAGARRGDDVPGNRAEISLKDSCHTAVTVVVGKRWRATNIR
jgi:hypothetical protein